MSKKIKFIIPLLLLFFYLFSFGVAWGQTVIAPSKVKKAGGTDDYGLEATKTAAGIDVETSSVELPTIIGSVIGAFLSFLGVIFFILMIYGGFTWMMARGKEQEVEKAQEIIRNAVIGLIIVLSAYIITNLITSELATVTQE